MNLHRLRVVGFDTSVSEKEGLKNFNAELENYEQEDWKTSTGRNKDEIGDVDKCLDVNKSPPRRLPKKCLGDKRSLPEKSQIYIGDASRPSGISVKIYHNDKKTTPGTSKMCRPKTSGKILDEISLTSPPETLKKHSFTRRKSKSEIFKITPKKIPRKHDLKLNSSDTSLIKQFQGSTFSFQRKRSLNLRKRNSRVHHKVENVKENNDVQFLFMRKTPSFMRFCRKRAENEKTKTKNKRGSRSPNDIYGFQKSNRSIDQHQYQMSWVKFIDTDKIPFKKLRMGYHRKPKPKPQPVAKCRCKHHAMRILKSSCGYGQSMYYNLNIGPHLRRFQRNCDYDQGEGPKMKCLNCMAKDETVEVSPSSFGPKPILFCDACTSPSNVEVSVSFHPQPPDAPKECLRPPTAVHSTLTSEHSQKLNPPSCMPHQNAARASPAKYKCKKNRKKINILSNIYKRFFSRILKRIVDFYSNKGLSVRGFMKHVCILLWSPCLLAGVLVWVVMFPMKFINMSKGKSKKSFQMNRFRKNDPRSEYQRMSFENYFPRKRTSFISSMMTWCSRTVGIVVNSFNAVLSMFKLKSKAPTGVDCSYLRPSYPNPRKRYKLFYVGNRGWVMKSLRRRKTCSVVSSRVVQSMRCEFRPKMRCLNKRQQKSSKKVHIECPVPKRKRYPRRRSSLARHIHQFISTAQWASCSCSDAQGSKPLQSYHHGRHQVNIPPTFSISADERINIKPKKNNSKLIADNIAQEDLAKNRLGQSKNGTLPFGFDFKYPCGTKHLLITNSETSRDHTFGLAGKTLNMSAKITSGLVIKGVKGQLPKCWSRYESSNTVNKANDTITNFKDITINSMPTKHILNSKLNGLRRQTINRVITSNYPSGKSLKSSLTNKKLCSLQNNLSLRNKCVLAALSKSALNKQANTIAYKINNAHKTKNTTKHIPCQKVTNKCNRTENAYLDSSSKYTFGAKNYPPKQASKCKNCIPTQKHRSPVKTRIKPDITLNSSFRKIYNHSKQSCTYKSHHIPETLKQSNTADITSINRNIGLHCPCRHHQYKQGDKIKYKPHQIPSTLKQSNTADISTKSNMALHRLCRHKQSKQGDKYKTHNIPATLKQSNTSDIMTKSNRNMASHRPCRHKQYKQGYRYEPREISIETQMKPYTANIMIRSFSDKALGEKYEQHNHAFKCRARQIPVATQMHPNITDNVTMTRRDIALNCPSGEKHEQCYHALKYKARQIPVAIQMQVNVSDNVTMTSRDIALNCPSCETHEQSKRDPKYQARQIPVAIQMQPNVADNMTMTSRDIALNFPSGETHEQYNHAFKYKARQIPVAIQMQPNVADNVTMTSRDIALNCPSCETHEQSKRDPKYQARHIPVANQTQPNIADNVTMTSRDIALNFPSGTHEQCNHAFKYKARQIPVVIQMQPNVTDNVTMTSRDIALTCPSGKTHEQCNHAFKYKARQIPVAIQMQPNVADNVSMTSRVIAVKCLDGVKPSTANKEILCISKTADNDTKYTQDTSLSKSTYKYVTGHRSVTTQKQSNAIDVTTMTNRNIVLNNFSGEKYIQSTPSYKYKTSTNHDMASNYFGSVKPSTANKEIICIPKTADKDTICTQKNSSPEDYAKRQDISIQKQDFKIDESVYCAYDCKRSKTNEIVLPEQKRSVFGRSSFQSHAKSPLLGITSDCRYGLSTQITQVSKFQAKNSESKVECGCGVTPQKNETDKETATTHNTHPTLIQVPLHTSLLKVFNCACGTKQVGTECQAGHPLKLLIPHPDVSEQLRKNISQTSTISQATSPRFRIVTDCPCKETPLQTEQIKKMEHIETVGNNKYIHKSGSAKEPSSQQPTLTKVPSQLFDIAIECTCGTNQPTVAEKNFYDDVTVSKFHTAKKMQAKPNIASKKSPTSNILKLPEYLTSPKSSHQKCWYPVQSIQDPLGEQLYGTRECTTAFKRNTVKVDKTLSKFPKSPECLSYPKNMQCPCPAENLQGPIPQRSRKSIFSRKSLYVPHQLDYSSSHKDLDGRCSESDVSVVQFTTRRAPIRSCERPEDTYSVDKTSSQLQLRCSRLSQYSNSVNSLVMNLRSTLFSRKLSKQRKVPEHLKSSQRSTLSPYKTYHMCHRPIDNTEKPSLVVKRCPCQVHQAYARKPLLVDKSCSCPPSISKSSHRPSFLSHSSNLEYRCQPDNDNSSSSLRLSKIYSYLFPRLSQRIVGQQSKTSEHSSIVIPENPTECKCSIDETSSTPKDGMAHQILKTLLLRKPHSKSQQRLSQRNRFQFSAFNRSQQTQGSSKKHHAHQLSEKQSILVQYYRIIPGAYRCAKEHLGKTTSRQSSQNLNSSQKSTPVQKQSFKKFHPQYSLSQNVDAPMPPTAEQTVPLHHFLHQEPLKSKRSSFNLPQSKQLIEKIRSITHFTSTNSRKNKQEKRSFTLGAQTALIIPGKCACWPEKLHQLSKKISQHSRKSLLKLSPSQQSPNVLSFQPTLPYKNSCQSRVRTEAQAENPQHISIRQPSQPFQSNQLNEKIEKQFVTIFQRTKADQAKPIVPGRCKCVGGQKVKTEHSSNNKLEPNTDLQKLSSSLQQLPNEQPDIPQKDSLHRKSSSKTKQLLKEKVDKELDQRPEADLIIPIIPGRCRCAREQKIKTRHFLSNNKLQPDTDLQKHPSIQSHNLKTDHQRYQSPTVSHTTPKTTFGTDMQTEFSQRQNQPAVASKLSQPHTSQHAIYHNAPSHNSQPTPKSCKYCSFKHGHDQEALKNNLHKIAKIQSPGMLQHSLEKFKKWHLVSCGSTDSAKQNRQQQRSEIPQSPKNPQIQSNQQIQQNQQDQKKISQIPTNLDKPPPELLQRYSAGDRRKRTAAGGVQQPYPDFNRVSMRYPAHKGLRKQSVHNPGLNCNPTIPPCYINSANKCALQSFNEEAALRRAYRRRPLRYTPPRQIPRVSEKKRKKNIKKGTGIRGFFRCLLKSVKQAEKKAWPTNVACHPMWLTTLNRRPCFWIYKTCPRAYPCVLSMGKWYIAIRRLFAYFLTLCFWSPLILCFYLCCNVLCRSSS